MSGNDKREPDNQGTFFKSLRRRIGNLFVRKGIGEWTVICLTISYTLAECVSKFYHQHDTEALATAFIVLATFVALLLVSYDGAARAAKERRKANALRRLLIAERHIQKELKEALAASYDAQKQVAKLYADLATAKVVYRSQMVSQFPAVNTGYAPTNRSNDDK